MKRGDFHWCDLDPTQGREQQGHRPVLIVSEDAYHNGPAQLVIVVPVTTRRKRYPNRVGCPQTSRNGLALDSQVLSDQVRCISTERIGRRIGTCEAAVFDGVVDDLRIVLGI